MKRIQSFLFVIVLVSAVVRFYALASTPPSLTWDEVAWGYNGYTLSVDARDEFGRLLPVDFLESFGDFKPPMYAYLTVIPVALFGLTEFATRFPSALFGVLTVLVTYVLVKEIFYASKHKERYGLITAGVLALSPWHILLSRAAFEANIATFFIVLGVTFLLKSFNSKRWLIVLSAVSFVLSMYTFNTARIVAPLLVLVIAAVSWKKVMENKKWVAIAAVVGFILLVPALPFLFSPQARLRFQEVNIFSDITVIERTNQEIANSDNSAFSKIIHNRRVAYGIEYAKHYLDNLTPQFLFISGDGNPKFSTQNVGQMYLWEIPFLVMGALLLFKKREGHWWIVPLWLLIGIIPAATARETPHALRIEATLPTFQILVAYGIVGVVTLLSKVIYKNVFYYAYTFFVLFNSMYFFHGYFVHYPREYSSEWQYGYKEAIQYVKEIENNYETIYMTTEFGRPYAYFLFYLQTKPKEFRETAIIRRSPFGFVDIDGFGKYRFVSDFDPVYASNNKKVLYINIPSQVPERANVVKRVSLLNGQPSLILYTL